MTNKMTEIVKALRARADGLCAYAADIIETQEETIVDRNRQIEHLKERLKQTDAEPDRQAAGRATPEDRMRQEIFYRSVADNGEGVADG